MQEGLSGYFDWLFLGLQCLKRAFIAMIGVIFKLTMYTAPFASAVELTPITIGGIILLGVLVLAADIHLVIRQQQQSRRKMAPNHEARDQ